MKMNKLGDIGLHTGNLIKICDVSPEIEITDMK